MTIQDENLKTNPRQVIRLKCLDCCCGSPKEVEKCTVTRCPLYPWRLGKNPYRAKRELTDEQREAAAERFRIAREKKQATPAS